jgi:hypothetical protein
VIGLGSAKYISTSHLISTVQGLATTNYVSSSQLNSTFAGLATGSYISSSQLNSTLDGLATAGYVSSSTRYSVGNNLVTSSIIGLGSVGYFSSLATIAQVRSTFSNSLPGNWSNTNFLYSNLDQTAVIKTVEIALGTIFRSTIFNGAKMDVEVKTNLQFGYNDTASRDYQFNSLLVRGGVYSEADIIGRECFTYYILNNYAINVPFFFQEKQRFLVSGANIMSTIRDQSKYSTISLFHTFGPKIPQTNQLFASPASTACVTIVLDNNPR